MKLMLYNRGAYLYAIQSSEALGGAERQQWLLAQAMASRGHEVVIVVPETQPLVAFSQDNVHFVTCKPEKILFNIQPILRDVCPDWWYWRTNYYILGPLFYSAHRHHIRTAFATAFDTDCIPRAALTFRKYLWPLYVWGLNEADQIIVQHHRQLSLLQQKYRRKAMIVNSITTVRFPSGEAKQPYVAWVGSLRQTKRPHLIIKIAQSLPHVKFVVCGPTTRHRTPAAYGEQVVDELNRLPNVEYRGQVSPAEAQSVIENAPLFLSTAQVEGFPNTFLQAWSAGIAVISLEVDPGGIIRQHQLGYVAESLEELIVQLEFFMKTPAELEVLGHNGQQYVTKYHNADHVCQQLEAALGGLA